jgi:hypothetical protein
MSRAACVLCQHGYGERTNATGEEDGCPDFGEGRLVFQDVESVLWGCCVNGLGV